MAEGYQNNPYGSTKLYKGTNNTGKVILTGYNTGSGNYIDIFLPCDTSGITSATAYLSTETNRVYVAPDISLDLPINGTFDVTVNTMGIIMEYHYPTTQVQSRMATLSTNNIVITCS